MGAKRLIVLMVAALLPALPAIAWGWQRTVPAFVAALAVDGAGDVLTTGDTAIEAGAASVFTVRKVSGVDGAPLWFQRFQGNVASGNVGNGGLAITTMASGDVLAGGTLHDAGAGGDMAVFRLAGGTGAEVWRTIIDGAAADEFVLSLDVVMALGLDSAENAFVAGTLADLPTSTGAQFVVLKLDGTTGSELWRASLGDGYATGVAVDARGDVVAAGARYGTYADIAVAKFSGIDGTELWRVVIDGTAHSADQVNALALDASGNVVVAGAVHNTGTDDDLFVAKLSGTDGSELWRREIDGPGTAPPVSNLDRAYGVALDATGDVVVSGVIGNAATSLDALVLKLSGVDGSELWRHETGGPDQDAANAVRVDGGGNVVAVGTEMGIGGAHDFTIVNLDGRNGVERWRQVIPGTPGSGAGRLLALDPAGNAVASGDLLGGGILLKRAEALAGKTFFFKESGTIGSRRLKVASGDKGLFAPTPGTGGDPLAVDSVLTIRNPISAETMTIPLPTVGWTATSSGYQYVDNHGVFGPCTRVSIRAGRGIKMRCAGTGIGFSLNEAHQGTLMATLTLGGGPRYCMRFGGTVVRDTGDPMDGGIFLAKDAPPSASCDAP